MQNSAFEPIRFFLLPSITDWLNVAVAVCTFFVVLYGVRLANRAFGIEKRPFVYLKGWSAHIYDDGLHVRGYLAEGRQVPTIVHRVVTEFNIMGIDAGTVRHQMCEGVLICGEHSPLFVSRHKDTKAIEAYRRRVRQLPNLISSIASVRINVVLSIEGSSRKERWKSLLHVIEKSYDINAQTHIFTVDGNISKAEEEQNEKSRFTRWLQRTKRKMDG